MCECQISSKSFVRAAVSVLVGPCCPALLKINCIDANVHRLLLYYWANKMMMMTMSSLYLELVLDVDQPASAESSRWNVRHVNRVVPDGDVVLVCRTFLQSSQFLSLLLPPLVRLVVHHLETHYFKTLRFTVAR